MNEYFEEKASQYTGNIDTAFGIEICSRHTKAREAAEMLLFCEELARHSLHNVVTEVFYDSNSDCCNFTFVRKLAEGSPEASGILKCALKTITQFEWFGSALHKD